MLIVTLFGMATSTVVIDPINPILRAGRVTKMRCQVESKIGVCNWYIDGYPVSSVDTYGDWDKGECGYNMKMSRDIVKEVECRVRLSKNWKNMVFASTNVTVAVLPEIQLESEFSFDDNDTITVNAGEESTLYCNLVGVRPKPAVLWKIGNPIRNRSVC